MDFVWAEKWGLVMVDKLATLWAAEWVAVMAAWWDCHLGRLKDSPMVVLMVVAKAYS